MFLVQHCNHFIGLDSFLREGKGRNGNSRASVPVPANSVRLRLLGGHSARILPQNQHCRWEDGGEPETQAGDLLDRINQIPFHHSSWFPPPCRAAVVGAKLVFCSSLITLHYQPQDTLSCPLCLFWFPAQGWFIIQAPSLEEFLLVQKNWETFKYMPEDFPQTSQPTSKGMRALHSLCS